MLLLLQYSIALEIFVTSVLKVMAHFFDRGQGRERNVLCRQGLEYKRLCLRIVLNQGLQLRLRQPAFEREYEYNLWVTVNLVFS